MKSQLVLAAVAMLFTSLGLAAPVNDVSQNLQTRSIGGRSYGRYYLRCSLNEPGFCKGGVWCDQQTGALQGYTAACRRYCSCQYVAPCIRICADADEGTNSTTGPVASGSADAKYVESDAVEGDAAEDTTSTATGPVASGSTDAK
ncbi:hypothetical protein V1509DRAFT_635731 [Lipomyces kononenkoae]